jgi:hypothetical protein
MKVPSTLNQVVDEVQDFSLVQGGPLFQLMVRCRLATPDFGLLARRMVFISLFAWLPLLLLSLLTGRAWGGDGLSFLYDIETHARFLLALPLLVFAERLVHQRLRLTVGQFLERNIIAEEVLPRFKDVIASAMKLRNSVLIELTIFLLLFVGGHYAWSSISGTETLEATTRTWYASATSSGVRLSAAGYWLYYVGVPLFQFLQIRWYFRLFIWARLLWQISRLELKLVPTHPDGAASLGFLGESGATFAPVLMAHGTVLSGLMANKIFYSGARFVDFKLEIIGWVLFLLLMMLGPLHAFWPCLRQARRSGLREYGMLASRYVGEFDRKWVRGGAAADEALIGSGDIQSLADLGNSFQVIRNISSFPYGRRAVTQLVLSILTPISPLVLTMIPLEELIDKVVGTIF